MYGNEDDDGNGKALSCMRRFSLHKPILVYDVVSITLPLVFFPCISFVFCCFYLSCCLSAIPSSLIQFNAHYIQFFFSFLSSHFFFSFYYRSFNAIDKIAERISAANLTIKKKKTTKKYNNNNTNDCNYPLDQS